MIRSEPFRKQPDLRRPIRLRPEQLSTLENEFVKLKTLHETDLALLAAEMGADEREVQLWYTKRIASWRRDQGLSDCFGQI